LHEINYLMNDCKDKGIDLVFNFENKKRANLLYDKLTIFVKTYIDKITLSNSNISKSFLISINLR